MNTKKTVPVTSQIIKYLNSRKTPATRSQIANALTSKGAKESTVLRQITYLNQSGMIARGKSTITRTMKKSQVVYSPFVKMPTAAN